MYNKVMTTIAAKKERVLKVQDRCDRCGARALVLVQGNIGELMFCGHHYAKATSDAVSYDKLARFAKKIIDERAIVDEE